MASQDRDGRDLPATEDAEPFRELEKIIAGKAEAETGKKAEPVDSASSGASARPPSHEPLDDELEAELINQLGIEPGAQGDSSFKANETGESQTRTPSAEGFASSPPGAKPPGANPSRTSPSGASPSRTSPSSRESSFMGERPGAPEREKVDPPQYAPPVDFNAEGDKAKPSDFLDEFEEGNQSNRASRRNGFSSGGFRLAAGILVLAFAVGLGLTLYAGLSGGDSDAEPPLVEADGQPVRQQPENPGGAIIPNQDKVSYDKLAGEFDESARQPSLVRDGEKPVEILPSPSEGAPSLLSGIDSLQTAEDPSLEPRKVETVAIDSDGKILERVGVSSSSGAIQSPSADSEASQSASLSGPDESAPGESATGESAPDESVPSSALPVRADRDAMLSAALGLSEPDAQADGVSRNETASASAGAAEDQWSVQLSSRRSAEDAESTFRILQERYPDLLAGFTAQIRSADIEGKGVFYRVRVIAGARPEAVELCESLKRAGGACFVTR